MNQWDESAVWRRRVETLEQQLAAHQAEQRRLQDLVAQMEEIVESQGAANQHLEQRLRQQGERVTEAESALRSILESRIWRTLARAAGLLVRTPSPVVEAPAPTLPTPRERVSEPPLAAPLVVNETPPKQPERSVSQWLTLVQTAADDLPPARGIPRLCFLTPMYNTRPEWLAEAALSLFSQTRTDWEWCLVDDGSRDLAFTPLLDFLASLAPRVRVERRVESGGISAATNQALAIATAPYVACLDHDDVLLPTATARCLAELEAGASAVYTDSDKLSEAGLVEEPFHKPDWSPELFRGVMYVGHLLAVRTDRARELGGFRSEFDGVQDYEFFLRYSETAPGPIVHVSDILYHWRKVAGSVATASDAKGARIEHLQQRAVQEQLDRLGLAAHAERGAFPHRVRIVPARRNRFPKVSIVIPTKDAPDVLEQCLRSIYALTTYPNFEIVLADNDTSSPEALAIMRQFPVRRVYFPGQFHFSRINNQAARTTDGEYLLFANNDIEVLTPDWIGQMLYYAEQPSIGAVGALLLYPDRTVQHAGVVLGVRGTADHVSRFAPGDCDGYAGSLSCAHEVTAVTAACLLVERRKFEAVGGFSEHFFTAYQDVELCLQLRARGWGSLFTPQAKLVHHESYSRGKYYDFVDRYLLLDEWEPLIASGDPYFNRHFDLQKADYTLAL